MSNLPIVFDNLIFSLQARGGVSRFWSNLISGYLNNNSVRFLEYQYSMKNIHRPHIDERQIDTFNLFPLFLERTKFIKKSFFDEKFIFHSSYYRACSSKWAINVVTLHDLMHEIFLSDLKSKFLIKQKIKALTMADCIVCISNNTKNDLFKIYPTFKKKRVEVIPNGVSGFYPINKLAYPQGNQNVLNFGPYFLYVGNRGLCKGFSLIHDVIDLLERKILCVVVGDSFTKEEKDLIKKRGHENLIKNIGIQDDQALNFLYCNSYFFFFPSFYEGFGLPLLEAMSSGALILSSNIPPMPEVAINSAIFFNPSDLSSLKSAIASINSNRKDSLIKNGFVISRSYSWNAVASKYNNLYQDLYSKF